MAQDDRLERPVGGDDGVRRGGAHEDGLAQRKIRGALERRSRRIRGAELLEPLRIQHERRRRRTLRPRPRIPEHARAEAVDDVRLAVTDEIERPATCPQPEERIRRAAVEHGRAAAAGAGERVVRDELRPH